MNHCYPIGPGGRIFNRNTFIPSRTSQSWAVHIVYTFMGVVPVDYYVQACICTASRYISTHQVTIRSLSSDLLWIGRKGEENGEGAGSYFCLCRGGGRIRESVMMCVESNCYCSLLWRGLSRVVIMVVIQLLDNSLLCVLNQAKQARFTLTTKMSRGWELCLSYLYCLICGFRLSQNMTTNSWAA